MHYTGARLYTSAVLPLYRNRNKHPHGYEGRVYCTDLHAASGPQEPRVIWITGAQRLREVAMLMSRMEADRLRLELVTRADTAHLARLEEAARLREWPDGRHRAFTMKGKRHSEETRARMSASAKASWASGQRSPPAWLHTPNPLPSKQPAKAPPLRLVSSTTKPKSATSERIARRSDSEHSL